MDIQRTDVRKRRYRKLVSAGLVGLLFIALVIVAISLGQRPPGVDGDDLYRATVERGEFVREITGSGTLVAPDIRTVTNRSEGVVERILVLNGDAVEAGDVLIEMSSPTLEDERDNARWDLESAEAEEAKTRATSQNDLLSAEAAVASAEVEYTKAKMELEAQEALGENRTLSAIQMESQRLTVAQQLRRLDVEKAKLAAYPQTRAAQEQASRAKLAQLRQKFERAQQKVDDLHVRASVDGVVQEVTDDVELGARLGANQAVAKIVNLDLLIAQVGVSEREAALVSRGLPVRLELGRETLSGIVTRIDPTVRDRLVTVDIELTSMLPSLRPELSVTARIELDRVADVLKLRRPVGLRQEGETIRLFRLSSNGNRAELVDVEVGRASASEVEIVRGLKEGDEVIIADMTDWMDQEVIRIR